MVWVTFLLCAAAIVVAGTILTRNADCIAERTGLGKAFVGSLLLAGATSAPELMTNISAARMNSPDLVVGNVLGSNLCNMALLGIVDLWFRRVSVLANVALAQAFAAGLAVFLTVLTGAFVLLRSRMHFLGAGIDVWLMTFCYLAGMWFLRSTEQGEKIMPAPVFLDQKVDSKPLKDEPAEEKTPRLTFAIGSFAIATLIIMAVAPRLTVSADRIAALTGLGPTFVGTALLAFVTSLPELTASFMAVRMGSYDLAVGNLFGSNAFNIMLLLVGDLCYRRGPILSAVSPTHAVTGLLASALMMIGLMSITYRGKRKATFIQFDALLIVLFYLGSLFVLYAAGKAS